MPEVAASAHHVHQGARYRRRQEIVMPYATALDSTGHILNLEEPALFNETLERFLGLAEAGRWPPRDPASRRVCGTSNRAWRRAPVKCQMLLVLIEHSATRLSTRSR